MILYYYSTIAVCTWLIYPHLQLQVHRSQQLPCCLTIRARYLASSMSRKMQNWLPSPILRFNVFAYFLPVPRKPATKSSANPRIERLVGDWTRSFNSKMALHQVTDYEKSAPHSLLTFLPTSSRVYLFHKVHDLIRP